MKAGNRRAPAVVLLLISAHFANGQDAAAGAPDGANGAAHRGSHAIRNSDLYERTGTLHPFVRMPRFILSDQKRIWTTPFHIDRNTAKAWAGFGGATLILIAFDEQIQHAAPNTPALVTLGTRGSYLGASYTLLPMTAAFYFLGPKLGSERFRETGLLGFEALADATIVGETLKLAFNRERPLRDDAEGRFFHNPDPLNASFPSGHSINTFALASVFAHEYRDKPWVEALAYAYAGGVALARLAADRHFASDTLAGGAMGWFIGDYVYRRRHNPATAGKPGVAQWLLQHVRFGFSMN